MTIPTQVAWRLAPIVIMATLAIGCGPQKQLSFLPDTKFSLNVAEVNPKWPSVPEDDLTPAELAVFQERGYPDMIHLIWSRRYDIVSRETAAPINRKKKMKPKDFKTAWLYLKEKEEVRFPSPTRSEVIPLTDKLDIICKEGDCIEIKTLQGAGKKRVEKWHYYGKGIIYMFEDDDLVDTQNVPSMPSYPR